MEQKVGKNGDRRLAIEPFDAVARVARYILEAVLVCFNSSPLIFGD